MWELLIVDPYFEGIFAECIIFAATGLFVYWTFRAILLLRGTEAEINQTLDRDLEWAHTFLENLRMLFVPRYLTTL